MAISPDAEQILYIEKIVDGVKTPYAAIARGSTMTEAKKEARRIVRETVRLSRRKGRPKDFWLTKDNFVVHEPANQ